MNTLLKGKTILIMGVANKWSIAWGIAEACLDAGANLIFTYQEKEIYQTSKANSGSSQYFIV